MYTIHHYHSPLGPMTMASDQRALTGLWFDDQKYFAVTLPPNCPAGDCAVFDETAQWLDCYFRGQKPTFLPPIKLEGSPFRLAVWDILTRIPYGQTMTYGEIAAVIAQEQGRANMSAQAVGGAVGHNPISILVPCHRVIGSNGKMVGYAGGVDKKIRLLELEKRCL